MTLTHANFPGCEVTGDWLLHVTLDQRQGTPSAQGFLPFPVQSSSHDSAFHLSQPQVTQSQHLNTVGGKAFWKHTSCYIQCCLSTSKGALMTLCAGRSRWPIPPCIYTGNSVKNTESKYICLSVSDDPWMSAQQPSLQMASGLNWGSSTLEPK